MVPQRHSCHVSKIDRGRVVTGLANRRDLDMQGSSSHPSGRCGMASVALHPGIEWNVIGRHATECTGPTCIVQRVASNAVLTCRRTIVISQRHSRHVSKIDRGRIVASTANRRDLHMQGRSSHPSGRSGMASGTLRPGVEGDVIGRHAGNCACPGCVIQRVAGSAVLAWSRAVVISQCHFCHVSQISGRTRIVASLADRGDLGVQARASDPGGGCGMARAALRSRIERNVIGRHVAKRTKPTDC